jgi:hypothetical protein
MLNYGANGRSVRVLSLSDHNTPPLKPKRVSYSGRTKCSTAKV